MRKLVYGRIDLAVIDRRVAEYLIRTTYPHYASRIEPMQPALAEVPLYIAFSRKAPRLGDSLTTFNRGLAAMRMDRNTGSEAGWVGPQSEIIHFPIQPIVGFEADLPM